MKKKKIITIASISFLGVLLAAVNVAAGIYSSIITDRLCGTGTSFGKGFNEAAAESDTLCQNIAGEGITLLKNKDSALPLSVTKGKKYINLFGWASSDQGFLLSGIGSGSSTISDEKKVTLKDAFEKDGWECNPDLIAFYNQYDSTDYGYTKSRKLIEPDASDYSKDLIWDAQDFSDIALVVFSRVCGENVGEVPTVQNKTNGQGTDEDRNYLELSTQEEALLDLVEDNFDKVIVVINSTNQMSLKRLNDDKIGAVLNVGILGQSGAMAIPKILEGEINPSGHLTDTFAYDYRKEPSYANRQKNGSHLGYLEDLYFGYRWYETADTEGYFDSESFSGFDRNGVKKTLSGYDAVVQYPFGYGLSYSSFLWNLDSVKVTEGEDVVSEKTTGNVFTKDTRVVLSFSCKNTGKYSGKDVMEVFGSAPYTQGGIEKNSSNLLDFAKTTELAPGSTQKGIEVSFDSYDLASYDCYDANRNGFAGYELEQGDYTISFMADSHDLKAMEEDSVSSLSFEAKGDIQFDKDPVTGEKVENRFTGTTAYSGVPLDGSTLYSDGSKLEYLSRSDFKASFPTEIMKTPTNSSEVSKANNYTNTSLNQTTMPTLGANNGLLLSTKEDGSKASTADLNGSGSKVVLSKDLLVEIGENYDSDKLDKLVDQVTAEEACYMVENAGFKTPSIESIGKTRNSDYDGPAGFNVNTLTGGNEGKWTAFPDETLVGQTWSKFIAKQMGLSMGLEGKATSLSGWYAPGVNLHRSPFNGRNYEYYSEDPVLSGVMASNVIDGAKANDLYCYLKHLALSEPGDNPKGLNTWCTEQAFRELYLKPFEIAVKKGKANAVMSAFNNVGGVWAGANGAMNIDVLRNEWGFRGTMITDWSDGSGTMNTKKGIRAGNDIWLNPIDGKNSSKLNRSDATDVYCAKQAVKDVVYTYCNTYAYALKYDHSQDSLTVVLDAGQTKKPFAWWIPVLISVDVLLYAGLGVWLYFGVIRKPKKKEE
jgi:beta-glucosidase